MSTDTEKKQGYYFGTEIDETWWKRYTQKGFFVRGLGNYWIDNTGLHFQKYLSGNPFTIFFSDINNIKTGKWHAGRWGHGCVVTKILWNDGEKNLSSGFILAQDKKELEHIHLMIKNSSGIKV